MQALRVSTLYHVVMLTTVRVVLNFKMHIHTKKAIAILLIYVTVW